MKTSNKIILGILLVGFGCMAAAQLSLHKKYVDNEYITNPAYEDMFYSQYKPQGIKHVVIQNIAACQILPSDTLKLAFENGVVQYAKYSIVGDTLHIKGVYTQGAPNGFRLFRSSQDVRLYLPTGIPVQAENSNLAVQGVTKQSSARNYSFDLSNSGLNSRMYSYKDSVHRYFDTINVNAYNYGGVYLYECDHVNTLNITLDTAGVNDNGAQIAHINVLTKRKATVVLSGDNLKNLNSTVIK
jgi:hypothetical protein